MLSTRKLFRTILAIVCAALALAGASALADPPARVARLAYVQGPVSFAPGGEDEWVVARVNRPLVTGDRVWTDTGARAELQIGSATLRFGATTSATALNIDDRIAQFQITQGTVGVSVRRLAPDQTVEIDTPNLALLIRRPGNYRIDVDASGDSTAVGVRNGEAEVYGEGAAYAISGGQWYRFYATGLAQRQYAALPAPDPFDQWVSGRDRRRAGVATARYVSTEVIGYEDLDDYGTWTTVPQYGPVWTPTRVASDWAPYREGRWSWIAPWGWTWVDAAPWGFAPYHYGRWAFVRARWYWVPGPRAVRPVYAPALVAFVGDDNFRLTIATGPATGVAWFPLAPGEVYRPSYTVSRDYFTRVNVTNTKVNTTIINNVYNNNVTNVTYRNRDVPQAITAVPSTVFVQSAPVAAAAIKVSAADVAKVKVAAVAPVVPSRVSVLGTAQPAPVKPSQQVLKREVVAKTKPPPMPVSFEAKEQALAKQPGRPLASDAAVKPRQEPRADAPKIKVVAASRQPEPAPKSSREAVSGKGEAPAPKPPVAQPPVAKATPAGKEAKNARDGGRPTDSARPTQTEQSPAASLAGRPPDQRTAERAPEPAKVKPDKGKPDARDGETRPAPATAARPPDQRTAERAPEPAKVKPDKGKPDARDGEAKPAAAARPPDQRTAERAPQPAKVKPDKGKPDAGDDEAKPDDERQRHAKRN